MSTTTTAGNNGRAVLVWIFLGLALVLALTYGKHQYAVAKEKAKTKQLALEEARATAKAYALAHPPPAPEFPLSGEGVATTQVGLKLWLDPTKIRVRTSRPARYVFVKDETLVYEDAEETSVIDEEHEKKWKSLIPGEYTVYPRKGDKVYIRWGNQ